MNLNNENIRENLKKRLELELGLPLTPRSSKQVDNAFNGDCILVENFPIKSINKLKIGNNILKPCDYIIGDSEGIIYLKKIYAGFLYLEYIYGLDESEFSPLLDLMVEYETDVSWNKDVTSIHENNVSVNYDSNLSKGALIQSMISDLKAKYSVVVEMI